MLLACNCQSDDGEEKVDEWEQFLVEDYESEEEKEMNPVEKKIKELKKQYERLFNFRLYLNFYSSDEEKESEQEEELKVQR